MITYDLATTMASALHIKHDSDESLDEWYLRVFYSAAGKMALSSLWDNEEEKQPISVQHFKTKAENLLKACLAVYPSLQRWFSESLNDLVEDIYNTYKRTGHLYHSSYRTAPAIFNSASSGELTLIRGASPGDEVWMSGLGLFAPKKEETTVSISELFGLQTQSMADYLKEIMDKAEWRSIQWPEETEFINLRPAVSKRYWKNDPDKDGNISLARYALGNNSMGEKIYVLYRYGNEGFMGMQLPRWRVRDFRSSTSSGATQSEYFRIANALLFSYQTRPPIKAKIHNETVEIDVGYILPPTEEDFFKLYRWPHSHEIKEKQSHIFNGIMSRQFYLAFRQELESIGYSFEEE